MKSRFGRFVLGVALLAGGVGAVQFTDAANLDLQGVAAAGQTVTLTAGSGGPFTLGESAGVINAVAPSWRFSMSVVTVPSLLKDRKRNGSPFDANGLGPSMTWKCKWGASVLPLLPNRPIVWLRATCSPTRTRTEPGFRWA